MIIGLNKVEPDFQLLLSLNPKGYYGCSRCYNHGWVWAHGLVCNYQFIGGWNTFILMATVEREADWMEGHQVLYWGDIELCVFSF